MALKLFRRHSAQCENKYKKDFRIYEHDSERATKRKQCSCMISAEGTTTKGNWLNQKSTKLNDWKQARVVADAWEADADREAGALVPVVEVEKIESMPVRAAIEDFTALKKKNGTDAPRMAQYRAVLDTRLLEFTAKRGIVYIEEMDNAQIWSDFRLSWKNKNPFHNRKMPEGTVLPEMDLKRSTDTRMISDLRAFVQHCVSREWLSEDWTDRKKHKMGVATKRGKQAPKEPFADLDLAYVYRACELVSDGKGWRTKRIRTKRGFQTLVFIWFLRYTGLRISDVVLLATDKIVPFVVDVYTHALECCPGKTAKSTGATVHIPLPNGKLPGDPDLISAAATLPLNHGKYFFFNPRTLPIFCGCLEEGCKLCQTWAKAVRYATNNWRSTITRVFELAAELMAKDGVQFSVHPHPHRFRHTFACRWLEMGASLRMVAEFLGDTEETVRKHYGGFYKEENKIAGQVMANLTRNRQITSAAAQPLLPLWRPVPGDRS